MVFKLKLFISVISVLAVTNFCFYQEALADGATKPAVTVLLGVDGFSYQAFQTAQQKGLFKAFKNTSAHIAPFPTMTDLTWSTLTKTAEIFGPAGRIRHVEATYFDDSTKSIQGDPRDYYRRLAFPKYYLTAFQNFFNPYVEGLMYFPTREMAKVEIDNVVDAILKSKETLITGYVGGIDSTAHTQLNRLFPVLIELDKGISRILTQFAERQQAVEIILVSDHGNIGRFKEGAAEQELQPVDIKPFIEKAGFRNVQQLTQDRDVAIPMLALGTWAPVYMQNRSLVNELLESLSQAPWFDLAIHIKRNTPGSTTIEVTGPHKTVAQIIYNKSKKLYQYLQVSGNPLSIPENAISTNGHMVPLNESQLMELSANTPYPDAISRLVDSVSNKDFDFPDLIVTMKDGYFLQNSLSSFTKMYRTHGSLTAASTYGVLTSTQRTLPSHIRTKDILSYLNIEPRKLFGRTALTHNQTATEAQKNIFAHAKQGIETEARNLSSKRIFQIMSRFIGDTRAYFVVSEIDGFLRAFNIDPLKEPTKENLSPTSFNLTHLDPKSLITTEDIGELTDVILHNQKSPLTALAADPRVEKIKAKLGVKSQKPDSDTNFQTALTEGDPKVITPLKNYFVPGKRGTMKMYQLPHLLEKAISIPEKVYLPESRDVFFAQYWNDNQERFSDGTYPLDTPRTTGTVADSLFKDVIREQSVEEKIFPTALDKLYNRRLKKATIVYVPGIYNSLFDNEIFSLGLASLREDLGLRVIIPPVESICAADYNGKIILNYLKEDYKRRLERGFEEPSYLILGYSKGTVDVLQAMTQDREFFAKNVLGLVSIASPLHGSSILDKTDLPFALIDVLSENQGPAICHREKPSGPSISPAAMDSFWRKNERSLIGLTRYFSITFKSEPENSHLFMKATKLIAQFDEDNDGVVTESSSKFPVVLGATNLGTIEADHLAGILSSKFDQKSFLRGVVNTMAELDIENNIKNLQINAKQILLQSEQLTGKKQYRLSIQPRNVKLRSSLLTIHGLLHPTEIQASASNTLELNKLLIPESHDPANDYQVQVKLTPNQLTFDPYKAIDVQKLSDIFSAFKVNPNTPDNTPGGIHIDFHHDHMAHFRMDHQLNYESRSPLGMDDNETTGYKPAKFDGDDYLLMRSKNNSIRLTTLSYRFRPNDFPHMQLKLAVTKGVKGADPVLGGAGRDDSAFQVWFTIRYGNNTEDRTLVNPSENEVILFGYYWGDPSPNGQQRQAGQIFENWYSKRNVVVATLPESKQLLLNSQDMLGKAEEYKQNLVSDLQRAFPDRDVNKMEILAITIQHDSNDSEDSSEAYFKYLQFLP